MIEISMGLIFALVLIYTSRILEFESWSYTFSLILLPLIYMMFGLFSEGENIVLMESIFGIPYFLVALVVLLRGFRWSAYVVAVLWFTHALYDMFHSELFVNTGVFSWYPHFCAAVDFAIGAYVLWCSRAWPSGNISLAGTRP